MRSWIYGYFGHNNIGDNAILESTILNLRSINQEPMVFTDNVPISMATTHAKYVLGPPFDVKNGLRGMKYKLGYWLRAGRTLLQPIIFEKNVCIYACGGAINDHVPGRVETIRTRIRKFKKLGFRMAILGAGVNPLVTEIDQEAARSIITDLVDYCSVRDTESASALEELGIPKERFYIATDTVFSLPIPAQWSYRAGPLHEKTVGLNMRPLFEGPNERGPNKSQHHSDYIRNIQILIDRLSQRVGGLELIPMSPDDNALYKKFTLPENVRIHDFIAKREDVMSRMASLDIFIGSRFHSLVFSIMMGVPFVVIPYSPKVISMAKLSGIEYASLIVGDGAEVNEQGLDVYAILNELENTWENAEAISHRFLSMAGRLSLIAKEDFYRCWSTLRIAAGQSA